MRYERNSFSTSVGITHAEDRFEDGENRTSDIVEGTIAQNVFDGRMTLRASASTAISPEAENSDYPTSLIFGADYKLMKGIDLIGEYEQASGVGLDATMTRIGVRANPWSRTQIDTYLTQEVSEFGPRVFANVGLIQGFQLDEHWTLDFGVDQTNTLTDSTLRQFDPDRELASGSLNDDFVAAYAGAMYSAELWSANTRLEHRNSDSDKRTTLLVGWYREPMIGHGLSAGMTIFRNESILGDNRTSANLKIGWAYRKAHSQWSFLNRTDLVYEGSVSGSQEFTSWRFINNFNANRRFNAAMQLSLQYAFKYVLTEFDDDGYSGYTDLIGVDWRRGFKRRWDVGVNTSIYHSYRSGVIDYGFGVDVGFNLMNNMWVTLGYNARGFYDTDFAQARYTAQGPYLRFTVKADQHFLKKITGR